MHLFLKHTSTQNIIIAFTLFCVSLIYYVSLLHLNIAHAHDSPDYYNRIISGQYQLHAHHVLYEPISFFWYHVIKFIVPSWHPFKIISLLNSFFGSGCVSLCFLIIRRHTTINIMPALGGTLLFSGSFYALNYATTVEVYHSALFFTLFAFYLTTCTGNISVHKAVLIGIIHGFAMGFHQMHFLLGFALLPTLLRAGFKQTFLYLTYGSFVIILCYGFACYYHDIFTIKDFYRYFMNYMINDDIVDNSSSPLLAPIGLGMALLGARYIFAIPIIQSLIIDNMPDTLYDRIFILHHKTSLISGITQISLYCIFLYLLFVILKHLIKATHWQNIKENHALYLVILCYGMFFTFWYPHNPEFWGLPLTFMIIAVIRSQPPLFELMSIAITVLLINLLGSGLPLLDQDNNLYPNGVQSLF